MKKINIKTIIKEGWKVDKAKIKYILRNKKDIQAIADCLAIDSRITKSYESFNMQNCKYNTVLELEKGNVYIGLEDNANPNIDESRKTIKIEYNPNKVNIFSEIKYLDFLKGIDLHRRFIMYVDLAFDIYTPIAHVGYKKRRKNEYRALIEHDTLETIYLRKFGTDGAVRIYDKTKELNKPKNEELEEETGELKEFKYYGDCTRYEIRVKLQGKHQQLMFNLQDPFFVESTVRLHTLWIKKKDENKLILEQIEKNYTNNEFKNLLLIHLGYKDKLTDNRTKKKYIELYKSIKKDLSSIAEKGIDINNFDYETISKTLKNYLDNITLNHKMQSKLLLQHIMDLQ